MLYVHALSRIDRSLQSYDKSMQDESHEVIRSGEVKWISDLTVWVHARW